MGLCAIDLSAPYVNEATFGIATQTRSSVAKIIRESLDNTTRLIRNAQIEDPKWLDLRGKAIAEINDYTHYLKGDITVNKKKILDLLAIVKDLNYAVAGLELTPDSAVKLTFKLPDHNFLSITKPLSSSDLNENEVIFSYFSDEELIMSDLMDIHALVGKFNLYLEDFDFSV